MSELLAFLNNASESDLRSKGLSAALSKQLIEARPFEAREDVLKVKGMSEEKLNKLETSIKEPIETDPSVEEEEPAPKKEKKAARVWLVVLRWVLIVLVLGAAVYAAIVYGVPYIYNTFLRPVENNAAQLSQVAAQQSNDTQRLSDEIVTLQVRVATLEARADALDSAIAAHDETLANLAALQSKLEQALSDQGASLNAELTYQVDLLRVVNYLSRSRLYLSQSNFGLARADALSARELLSGLQGSAPAEQAYALNEALNRLDLALSNLPAYPAVAVYDIDIAWQYLADGLSETAPTLPAPSLAPTEVTLTPEVTPTP